MEGLFSVVYSPITVNIMVFIHLADIKLLNIADGIGVSHCLLQALLNLILLDILK